MAFEQLGQHLRCAVGKDAQPQAAFLQSLESLVHTAATVTLYLEESFTFQVLSPQAAVRLAYSDGGKRK